MADRHKILIVDDDPEVLLATKMSLKRARYRDGRFSLLTATSGCDALDVLRDIPDVAVTIIDQIMETETAGIEACLRIRRELGLHRMRLILRSGLADSMPTGEGFDQLDLSCVLPKGEMTPESLLASLHEALDTYYGH